MNHQIKLTRLTVFNIEIVNREIYESALAAYWKQKDVLQTGESGFLQHLALLADEHGIIDDSINMFGVAVRDIEGKVSVKYVQ
jgi:hypothetical protein